MKTSDVHRTGAILAVMALLISGCTHTQSRIPTSSHSVTPTVREQSVTAPKPPAIQASPLDALKVAPDGPMAGYARARFGQPWRDTDHNGCDQRSDVLTRDAGSAAKDEKRPCQVVAISLTDPYTGETLTKLSDIQIDHVVALGAAWRAGASGWTDTQRELFATDERNLLAVKGRVNQAKSDDPPEKFQHLIQRDSWCRVARIYTEVSNVWHLTITPASHDALAEMLTTCRSFP